MIDYAQLGSAIPEELASEFLKRLPYVSEGIAKFSLMPGNERLEFELRPGFEGQSGIVQSRILEIADKLCYNHDPQATKTLVRQDRLPSSFRDDPHPLLQASGDLMTYGRGRYGFGPKLVALIEYFEARVREIAVQLRAAPHAFPALIGGDVLDRCRYIRNFPASLNLVSHLREDHGLIQDFARTAHWEPGQPGTAGKLDFDRVCESQVECLLAPSVCFHWYQWLQGTTLANPRAVTALGKCFRYESSNLTGLERLWDFSMREVIFVGEDSYVLSNRDASIEACGRFLEELGLAFEITSATDPFFVDTYAVQAAFQKGFDLKFELLVPLPYKGASIAVGSVNYHQDFFGRSFHIETGGMAAHTSCLGIGYERLALAFLAQHGMDPATWPEAIRSAVRG